MGQSQSSQPPPKAPTIVQYDPLPSSSLVSGIGVGGSTQACQYCLTPSKKETCGPCKLFVAQGISSSGVRMYREIGNVSREECSRYATDTKLVLDQKLAFEQFKKNLSDGKYFEDLGNGYCAQMFVKSGEESKLVDLTTVTKDKLVKPVIRKMTPGGGYSSTTKLFLKPSIPFRITLNGTTVDIATMTLFHPSPLRIENVQHDAVLTLNDTADSNASVVVLVPIVGSLRPKDGGEFFSRIASYIPGVLQPNPATNQYESVEVPTGNDWNLTKLFPGIIDEASKQTMVNAGFFTWKATPPLIETNLGVTKNASPNADVLRMGWKPATGVVGPTFVMLESPVEVNTFDLQMIRRLPVTPAEEAMPAPFLNTVTYTPKAKCDSGGLLTGKKEKFETKQDSCDPFAAMQPVSTITSDTIFSVVLGIMTAIAVFIGLYFALKYASDNNWGTKIQQWGRQAGRYFANAPPPGTDAGPAPAPAPAAPSGGPRPTQPRQGEDFAFTNDAAIELRRRRKAEQEELARLKKEADEAAAKAKADEAAEMEKLRKEADENAKEARDQEAARAEMERKAAAEAESRLARPVGPGKAAPTRTGEDFAFTNPLAERQRQKRAEAAEMARLKKEAEEAAAKARAEEAAEMEKLRKQAEAAAVLAKRREEAAGTGLLNREELQANSDRLAKEIEEAEEDRLIAEQEEKAAKFRARRKAMTPLQLAKEERTNTNDRLRDAQVALQEAQSYAHQAQKLYDQTKTADMKETLDKSKAHVKESQSTVDDLEAKLKKLDADIEELKRKEENPKQLKRRVILSSDRDLTAEEKAQKKKDEEMVARVFQPKKDYADRKPASSAQTPTSISAMPPAEAAKAKALHEKNLKELQEHLAELRKTRKTMNDRMRDVVTARRHAKTLRASPPKVPSQAEREIARVKSEADDAAKEAEKAAKETETQAERQQKFLAIVQDQMKKIKDESAQRRVREAEQEAKQAETEATKTKEDAEAEREKVARDLAAAQAGLKFTQRQIQKAWKGGKKTRKQRTH